MYALQDTAQFTQLLDASNAIGAQKHSRKELKRAFLRMDFEAKGRYLQSDRDQKPERLLRALEEQNAHEGTVAFGRGALQGWKAAEVAAMRLVELIVKEGAAERKQRKPKRQMDTWQKRTRAGVRKHCG
jgi:hypothetical protein